MGFRSMVDRIYNEEYYPLLHTNSKAMGTNDPGEGPSFTPGCMNGSIYVT